MIELRISGNTTAEFLASMGQAVAVFNALKGAAAAKPEPRGDVIEGEVIPPKAADKPKKTKPEPVKNETVVEAQAEGAPALKALRDKLQELGKKKGDETVWELMGSFGVKKASELPDDKRAAMIAAADEKLAE